MSKITGLNNAPAFLPIVGDFYSGMEVTVPLFKQQLLKGGIDNKTLDSLKKGKNITMITLEKLCRIIDCTPNDIVEFK